MIPDKNLFQKQLFHRGWRVYGLEDDDPFFRVVLDNSVFGLHYLSGNFTNDGCFEIYSIPNRKFTDIKELDKLFTTCRFRPKWDTISRNGKEQIIQFS